jgi:hypothetical protein
MMIIIQNGCDDGERGSLEILGNLQQQDCVFFRGAAQGPHPINGVDDYDQVLAVVHSLHFVLAGGLAGDCLVSAGLVGCVAVPVGWHRCAWGVGTGCRPDLAAGASTPRRLGRNDHFE